MQLLKATAPSSPLPGYSMAYQGITAGDLNKQLKVL
jgi:hypothetical protein